MYKELKLLITQYVGFWPMIFAVLISARILGFIYFPVAQLDNMLFIGVVMYLLMKGPKFNSLYITLCAYLPIEIILSTPDPLFKSWPRLGLLILVLLLVSPMICSEKAKELRKKLFWGTGICSIVISVLSFFCYFLGINYMRANTGELVSDYISSQAGAFGGLTVQSMILGPISGFAALFCVYFALSKNNNRYWYFAIACTGAMLFSASRAAFIATIIGTIILLRYFSKSSNLIKKRILPVLILGTLTFPIWNIALNGMSKKNQERIAYSGTANSREDKWTIRIEEFKDSPIYGIGFASVSNRDYYEPTQGIIELGSSWLGILSMTGIIGFVIFCMMFYKAAKNAVKYRTPEGALLAAALALVGVHMIAEGHVFAGGSHLCFLVWLVIGCCTDYTPTLYSKEQ